MKSSTFKIVTIAGATGLLGFHIADAFLNDGSYKIKILRQKPESENKNASLLASKGAETIYVDYNDKDDLVKALKGTDVVICAIGGHEFIPPQRALFVAAKEVVEFLQELKKSGMEYTIIIDGLFQEYLWVLGFDHKNKKANLFADGNTKVVTTALSDVGKYTVESLKLPAARNGIIRVAGCVLTLNELVQKFEEVTVSYDLTVRERYKNNTDPVPALLDDWAAYLVTTLDFKDFHNDKFTFTPRPITDAIKKILDTSDKKTGYV
ncbi:12332_t:CDS:2 [Racocetra fulgida]|uniref:12332_t:CDS:1 n=1 Tax=Racocetra fulgida TaxID=60492 RepID=A0A9N9G9Q0_9GLOM|nr:12332_t:CDS:2 [Racocetra fulgida]